MFTKFWDELAEGVAGRWTAQELGPALAFWGGGLLAWAWRYDWQALIDWLVALNNAAVYVALAVGGLLLLVASSAAMEWLQPTVLRLAEGYWPPPLQRLRFALARRVQARLERKETCWQAVAGVDPERRTAEQRAEYVRLDAELARYPVDPRHLLPFRLGNVLRAAEEYPQVRYGLVTGVCWPRLWLLLPQEARDALAESRERLDGATRFFAWSILFAVWTVWAWWAALVAAAFAAAAYWAMVNAAGDYGDLLRAAFDLHRFALYEHLRWRPPSSPAEEVACGQRLSEYLFRGVASERMGFTAPAGKRDGK